MAEAVNTYESKHLQNFELTEEGRRYRQIVIPSNREGDPHHNIMVEQMTDYMAEELLARKDGRGKRFVRRKPTTQTAEKAKVEAKK